MLALGCLLGSISEGLLEFAHAERPFVSATSAGILEPGHLEVEAGIGLSRNTRGGANESSWNLPELEINFGILENLELGIGTGMDLLREKAGGSRPRYLASAAETTLAAKTRLFKGEGAFPSVATEMKLYFPTQRRELLASPARKVNFTAVLAAGGEAGPLEYIFNLGGGAVANPKRSGGTVGSVLWAVAGELPLVPWLSAVAEVQGESIRGARPDNTFLAGLVWDSPWKITFDAAGIAGLSRGSDSWGITFGLTYAFRAIPWLAK